jgi:DNA-binding NtrC family response regulator
VAELRSALEHARLAAGEDRIGLEHLPREIRLPIQRSDQLATGSLAEVERAHILATLQRHGNHRGDTAASLGIHVNTLCKKLAQYAVWARSWRARISGARSGRIASAASRVRSMISTP